MRVCDGLVLCPECGSKLFKEEKVFAINKTINTQANTVSYKRIPYNKIVCAKCGQEIDLEEE